MGQVSRPTLPDGKKSGREVLALKIDVSFFISNIHMSYRVIKTMFGSTLILNKQERIRKPSNRKITSDTIHTGNNVALICSA